MHTPSEDKKRSAYLVFEGGGAKGFVHAATLRAIEQLETFHIRGCAGTSAGAIMAALVAVGYRGEEILGFSLRDDTNRITSILDRLDVPNATGLFERRHWWSMTVARFFADKSWLAIGIALIGTILLAMPFFYYLGMLYVGIRHVVSGADMASPGLAVWLWGAAYATVFLVAAVLAYFLAAQFRGLASLRKVEASLEALLAARVPVPDGRQVTFGDLRDQGIRLKVVAADISERELVLFSTESDDCRDMSVAEAVIASASIPLIFHPKSILLDGRVRQFVDGGIVSNLPAWVFDEETVNNREAWIFVSHLLDTREGEATPEKRGLPMLWSGFRTAMAGSKTLSTRGVQNLFPIEVESKIGLLDFDYHRFPIRFRREYFKAFIAASLQIRDYLAEERFASRMHGEAIDFLKDLRSGAIEDMQLRTSLARVEAFPSKTPSPYSLTCCQGFEGDPDRFQVIRSENSLIGRCRKSGRPEYVDLTDPDDRDLFLTIDEDGLLADRTPDGVRWSVACPLPPRPDGEPMRTVAITFDCTVPLGEIKDTYLKILHQAVDWHWSRKGEQPHV